MAQVNIVDGCYDTRNCSVIKLLYIL